MKKHTVLAMSLLCLLTLAGCGAPPVSPTTSPSPVSSASPTPSASPTTGASKRSSIPFHGDELYALVYLGYQEMEDPSFYVEQYLDEESLPIHYLSKGDYYLIIPRYPDTAVRLYRNDIETMDMSLLYEDPAGRPFIIQCNVSDIFPDATISLTHETETVEFSPFISLENGSVVPGDRGLDLTK